MGLWKPKPCSPEVRFKALKAPSRERKQQTSMGRQESSRLLWEDPVQQYPREVGQAGLQTKAFSLAEPAVPTAAGDRRSSREVVLNLAEHVAVPAACVCSVPSLLPLIPRGILPPPTEPWEAVGGGAQGWGPRSPFQFPLSLLHTPPTPAHSPAKKTSLGSPNTTG